MIMADLMLASLETFTRRTLLIAQNKCSPAEYRRMFDEKVGAAAAAGSKLVASRRRPTIASVLAPWRSRAVANAKRLRKK
jgi:hypothetical protein